MVTEWGLSGLTKFIGGVGVILQPACSRSYAAASMQATELSSSVCLNMATKVAAAVELIEFSSTQSTLKL